VAVALVGEAAGLIMGIMGNLRNNLSYDLILIGLGQF